METEASIFNSLLWILIKVTNYLAKRKLPQEQEQQDSPGRVWDGGSNEHDLGLELQNMWYSINSDLDQWWGHLPLQFQPFVRMDRPLDPTTEDAPPRPFPEIVFSKPSFAAAAGHYHFARMMLALYKTTRPNHSCSSRQQSRDIPTEVQYHCHEICGIAAGKPDPAARVHLIQPLFAAGQCLRSKEKRQAILELLRGIQSDTGQDTQSRVT